MKKEVLSLFLSLNPNTSKKYAFWKTFDEYVENNSDHLYENNDDFFEEMNNYGFQ